MPGRGSWRRWRATGWPKPARGRVVGWSRSRAGSTSTRELVHDDRDGLGRPVPDDRAMLEIALAADRHVVLVGGRIGQRASFVAQLGPLAADIAMQLVRAERLCPVDRAVQEVL